MRAGKYILSLAHIKSTLGRYQRLLNDERRNQNKYNRSRIIKLNKLRKSIETETLYCQRCEQPLIRDTWIYTTYNNSWTKFYHEPDCYKRI